MKKAKTHIVLLGFCLLWQSVFSQQSQQDCYRALSICDPTYSTNVVYPGVGLVADVPLNATCIPTGEQNSSWFQFNVISSGSFTFQLVPNNANDDYDYILYNLTNDSCPSIESNALAPARCNFSSTPGSTGLQTGASGTNTPASGSPQCQPISASTGEVYVLLINNYTASQNGYVLQIGGTASVVDNITPTLDTVTYGTACNPKVLRLVFSEPILCNTISDEITITGPSAITINTTTGVGCNTQGETDKISIVLSGNILVAGTYTITIGTGTDGNTFGDVCQNYVTAGSSITFTITNIGPTVTLNSYTNTACGGATGTINVNVTGGTQPYSYSWNTSPPQTTQDLANLPSGNYTLVVTDANGCTTPLGRSISQANAPTVTISTNTPVSCYGDNNGTAVVSADNGTPPYTFSWNTTPPQASNAAHNLSPGVHIVTVTDAAGCSRQLSVTTAQPPSLLVDMEYTNTNCGASTGTATASASGGNSPYTYLWNTTPAQSTQGITQLGAGVYTVTVKDARNCQVQQIVAIQSAANLGAAIINAQGTCDEVSGQATATTNNSNPPYSFQWNTTPVQTTPTAFNLPEGSTYVVVTDGSGCSQVLNVKIDTLYDVVAKVVSVTESSCGGSDGQIAMDGIGGPAPFTYKWLTNPVQTTATATGLTHGIYTVVITDANGCDDTTSAEVKEFIGQADFSWNEGCFGLPTTFLGIANSEVDTFSWNFGNPVGGLTNFDTGSTVTYTYPEITSYTITLIAKGRCVKDTVSKVFTINNVPKPQFQAGHDTLFSVSTIPFFYTGTPVSEYYWDFGNGLLSNAENPTSYYHDSGTYFVTLIVIDSNTCTDTVSGYIYVFKEPRIYLPNAFTPESGNQNDQYLVFGNGIESLRFTIFNRWGQNVYETNSVHEATTIGWDGTQFGKPLQQGVYGYKLNAKFINSRDYSRTGTITLIR